MSSYKEHTTSEIKEFQKKEQKGQNIEAIQLNTNSPIKRKKHQCGTNIPMMWEHGQKTR